MDHELQKLHERLVEDPLVRTEIDRYLLAAYTGCSLLVLPRSLSFSYHNLPDLTPYLRQGLATGVWGDNVLAMLMSPFSMHVKRTALTAHHKPVLSACVMRSAAINLLHGLLLGLYPYAIRHWAFPARVWLAGAVRALLCADEEAKSRFIETHEALMTFAMTEYLVNVLCDFCPVEEAMLVAKPCARFTINNLCDGLRQRCEASVALDPSERWAGIEATAKDCLPQLQRQLKICNARRARKLPQHHMKPSQHLSMELVHRALDMQVVRPGAHNPVAQVKVLQPDMAFNEIQLVLDLWRVVSVHWLPRWVREQQEAVLESRGSCCMLHSRLQTVHICLMCTMSRRDPILDHRCSYNCHTGALQCERCLSPMQAVNLMGRILRVHGHCHFLCPRCLRPTRYTGTIETCERCVPVPQAPDPGACLVCQSKNAVQRRDIVDVRALAITPVPLCARHAKLCVHSRRAVYDMDTLERDLYNSNNSGSV